MTDNINELLSIYYAQAGNCTNSTHDNGHDDSGSHDDGYHNDSHDNSPNG